MNAKIPIFSKFPLQNGRTASAKSKIIEDGSSVVKEENSEPTTVIAKINYPDFDPDDVDTWFICLEAAFSVNMVKQDKQKFYAVIVALGPRAKFFHSVIAKCNVSANNDRYETIKATAIAHFRPSETQRLTSLLSGMMLGDQKPSVLLSEMKRLGGDGCSDTVLSNLWLRALPSTVRSIIASMPTATLEDQAKVADKILEAPSNTVAAIRKEEDSTIASLESRIDALTRRLEDALSGNFRSRGRSSARSGNRSVGRRDTTPSASKGNRRWICWFHYRHGAKATKCEKQKGDNPNVPCIFYDGNVETYTRREKKKRSRAALLHPNYCRQRRSIENHQHHAEPTPHMANSRLRSEHTPAFSYRHRRRHFGHSSYATWTTQPSEN